MQPILKTKKTLIASALALGVTNVLISNAWAATATFKAKASTIPDVVVEQVTALTFGTAIRIASGGSCTLDAATPAEDLLNFNRVTGSTGAAGSNFNNLTGDGCINGTSNGSQAGVYKITGTGGSTVAITLAAQTESEFTYTPGNGCVPTYDGTGGATDEVDACTLLGVGTTGSLLIPASTSEGGTAGDASVANELQFTLGGTLAITNSGADLDPNTDYSANFDIVVVYE